MLGLYIGTITAGGTDGTAVSTDGTSPITASLNATTNEEKVIPVAIRTQAGYVVENNATISFSKATDKWALSADGTTFNAYGDALQLSGITAVNKIFHLKVRALSSEEPKLETDVNLVVDAMIATV